jgi:hypothetical protein
VSEHRGKESPGAAKYFQTLGEVFDLESKVLTAVLPHMGERGANDEERCRAFLTRVLPRKYSVGTGFIVCLDPDKEPSSQQDVVIFDGFLNSPLHAELSASVFPIEMVYATVEVKGRLDREALRKALQSIGETRQLSFQSHYLQLVPSEFPADRYQIGKFPVIKRPPGGYIFAYDTMYETLDGLKDALQEILDELKTAHLHGIVVLRRNWFGYQKPNRPSSEMRVFSDNAMMRFINIMLKQLRTVHITPADMGEYLKIETPQEIEDPNATLPGELRR